MRVLIITQPRSGALSICLWISCELSTNEIKYTLIHEPNLRENGIIEKIITEENIVVKIVPHDFENENIDFNKIISSFDKIIFHTRSNIEESAISIVIGDYLIENDEKFRWHDCYEVNDTMIEMQQEKIETYKEHLKVWIEKDEKLIPQNSIKTTYEKVFYEKSDVENLCNYLQIKNPKCLDKLDKKRRLRNGKIGIPK